MVESATRSALTAEIVERRSVVAFDGRPIEAEKLQALIQAARWAPSASNRQSWRVTLVRDGESRAALNAALSEGNQGWAPNAPLLVVFAVAAPDPERPGQLPKLMLDVGFAGQNMMLEAVHQGLRVHPMAGWNEEKVKAALDVPEENAVAFLLAVGYAGDVNDLPEDVRPKETRERVRNAVGENFFDGVFGEPWRG
ncbi:MAG: nitroreductase family protein [Chloroflexi bacterium]|nr:nitroreductase family protein [Chloroflexota bacterium]